MNTQPSPCQIWESAAKLHSGYVRTENQDAVLNRPDLCMYAVADGMGGHAAGAAASRLVVDSLSTLASSDNLEDRVATVVSNLASTNQQLVANARTSGQGLSGSTVAILLTHQDQGVALWVGDSRVYRYRDGGLQQMTRDHSQLEELIERGLVDRKACNDHPSSHVITRAIGAAATLEPEFKYFSIRSGDSFLICSDGLYNEVDEVQIASILANGDCSLSAERLLELTLQSPARDNFSFVVAHVYTEDNAETVLKPLVPERSTELDD